MPQSMRLFLCATGALGIFGLRACTPGDGILQLERPEDWAAIYRQAAVDVVKFVPASGAASRMFKHVFAYPDNAQDPLIKEL